MEEVQSITTMWKDPNIGLLGQRQPSTCSATYLSAAHIIQMFWQDIFAELFIPYTWTAELAGSKSGWTYLNCYLGTGEKEQVSTGAWDCSRDAAQHFVHPVQQGLSAHTLLWSFE